MDTSNERKVWRRKDDDGEDYLSVQPEHLLVEILLKLSVKDVVRCGSVSKYCYALTRSTSFTNKHFVDHCHDDDDNPSMIFTKDLRKGIFKGESSICGISLLHDGKDESISLKLPLLFRNRTLRSIEFLGCCSGLVCILLDDKIVDHNNQENVSSYRIVVWNPTTKNHRIIPKPDTSNLQFLSQGEKDDITRYYPHSGFGFLHHNMVISTEYTLVRFFYHPIKKDVGAHKVTFRALVFAKNTNSWNLAKNELEVTLFGCVYPRSTVTLNGVAYWKVHLAEQEPGLMSFDLRHQVFNLIKLTTMVDLQDRYNWGDSLLYSWRNSLVTDMSSVNSLSIWTVYSSIDNTVWTPLMRLDFTVLPTQQKFILGIWKDRFMFSLVVRSGDVYYERSKYLFFRKQLLSYHIKSHKTETDILKSEERICVSLNNYTRTLASV